MNASNLLLIGLMSGTSVDGIDAALVEISEDSERRRYVLRHFVCLPWEPELREVILDCCRPDAPIQKVTALNYRLGEEFAKAARKVAEDGGVPLSEVAAIASHGQTLWHQPTPLRIAGADSIGTLQIGEASVIAARTGCKVVSDFRAADMARGGQGAPLVPFADFALFSDPKETRAVQNLGGIANVAFLPAGGKLEDVIAFDTGPGNMLLDSLMHRVSQGKETFDRDGRLAAQGQVSAQILDIFLNDAYFAAPPPKSTGREKFGEAYTERLFQAALQQGMTPPDILATATALTVETIVRSYKDFLLPRSTIQTVIAGGGGVLNSTLMENLRIRLAPARLTTHAEFGLPDEAKEAVAFALLAYETLHGRPSNVPSATGASAPALLGTITPAPPPTFGGKLSARLDKSASDRL